MYIKEECISQIFSDYTDAYHEFVRDKKKEKESKNRIRFNIASSIVFFESKYNQSDIFVVVPSIFNSADILAIGSPNDLLSTLSLNGAVCLIEWHTVYDNGFNITAYAETVIKIIEYVSSLTLKDTKIHIVGHCLGGILSIAAGVILKNLVHSMILLTCPWDLSYLQQKKHIMSLLKMDDTLDSYAYVPATYIRILFFLLDPKSFQQKLEIFQINQGDIARKRFLEIELWQFSGLPITKSSYVELMDEFIAKNILLNKMWVVSGITVDPAEFNKPTLLVVGSNDHIAPKTSITPLSYAFKNAELIEYNTGHIGYLVGSYQSQFKNDIISWIQNI